MSSVSSDDIGDSDGDDSGALEALGKKFANELDIDGLVTHTVSALTLEEQLAYKTKNEAVERIEKECESLEEADSQQMMKAAGDKVIAALVDTFKITRQETSKVLPVKPGRHTLFYKLSGSLFSAGTKIGMAKLLDEKRFSEDFEMIMRDQLTKDIDTINVNSLVSNCSHFPPEERHCLAKYLLFVMSVCTDERIVDTIYEVLFEVQDFWPLSLMDYLNVFNNWGVPNELLHPPFIFSEDTCTIDSSPDCNFEVAEYNVFKILDCVCETFVGKVLTDVRCTMTIVRVLMLLWLDKRLALSWNCYKFGLAITRLLEGMETLVGTPEIVNEVHRVVWRVLDLSTENLHNEAWLITKLLESNTPSSSLVGRCVATQFLLRAFDCEPSPHPGLDLGDLHALLTSQAALMTSRDLYTVHLMLLVVDTYLTSYHTTPQDQETLQALLVWSRNIAHCYADDAQCEILDRQIVLSQLKNIEVKVRFMLKEYFGVDQRRFILFGDQAPVCGEEGVSD